MKTKYISQKEIVFLNYLNLLKAQIHKLNYLKYIQKFNQIYLIIKNLTIKSNKNFLNYKMR